MGKIICYGGGKIDSCDGLNNNIEFGKEVIKISGKKSPKLLYIPTASEDSLSKVESTIEYFGNKLGCLVDVLYLVNKQSNSEHFRAKILSSDIIYVSGGNPIKLMKTWRKHKIDKFLVEAYEKGIVLAGKSAGAICWYKYGGAYTGRINNGNLGLMKVRGIGIINATLCAHYNTVGENRRTDLRDLMKKSHGVAIALDNCCGIEINDGTFRIVSSSDNANAYKVYWCNGNFYEEIIEKSNEFKKIELLLSKRI